MLWRTFWQQSGFVMSSSRKLPTTDGTDGMPHPGARPTRSPHIHPAFGAAPPVIRSCRSGCLDWVDTRALDDACALTREERLRQATAPWPPADIEQCAHPHRTSAHTRDTSRTLETCGPPD